MNASVRIVVWINSSIVQQTSKQPKKVVLKRTLPEDKWQSFGFHSSKLIASSFLKQARPSERSCVVHWQQRQELHSYLENTSPGTDRNLTNEVGPAPTLGAHLR